jgi:cholesterol transport system auxiliary component
MTIPRLVLAAALALALGSCGGILPKPPPAPQLFRLTPIAAATAPAAANDAQLVVEAPGAPASLDTERIALARGANGFDYFADAAWTDRAPAMLQALVIDSLANAGQIRVVAPPSGELRPDAVLQIDLRQFEAVYQGGAAPAVHVRFDCRLVRLPDRIVLATRSFSGEAAPSGNNTPDIVAAFDQAFHAAMGGLAPWAAQNLPARR